MKKIAIFLSIITLFAVACKKNNSTPSPQITYSQTSGMADSTGKYTMTGLIHSDVKLAKVTLTKDGQTTPFITDVSTAQNKLDYSYSYLVSGITANTYIIIDIYDQNGTKTSSRFLITK